MMTTFDEREQAFENKFKHDEEQLFRIYARRAKLMGLWAAEKMGITDEAADSYAKQMVAGEIDDPGHEAIFRRIRTDFDAKGVACSDHAIEKQMAEMLDEARRQVMEQ